MRTLSPATAKILAPVPLNQFDHFTLDTSNDLKSFVVDCWFHNPAHTSRLSASEGAREILQRLRGKALHRQRGQFDPHEIPACDTVVDIISTLIPESQLEFTSDQARELFTVLQQQSLLADWCAENTAKYKATKEIPQHDLEHCGDQPLSLYQQCALVNSYYSPGYGLFMEQGAGKTPIPIAMICNAAMRFREQQIADGVQNPRMFRAIVVAPNSVRANWQKEVMKFATQCGRVTILRDNAIGRVKLMCDALAAPTQGEIFTLVVCGYETLVKSWEAISGSYEKEDGTIVELMQWDLACLDEAHFIKSVKTKRYEYAMKLRDISAQRIVLTGTPVANTPLDLFALFEFMGAGFSGFPNWTMWKKFYGVYDTTANGHELLCGMQNLPFMQERLARYSFIISKKEALPDLPDKVYDIHEVSMTPQQSEYYTQIASQLALEIERDLQRDDIHRSMLIQNILTKLLRLSQITSGFVSWGEVQCEITGDVIQPKTVEYFSPNPKIEALCDLLMSKSPNDKTIVWACWIPDIEYICAALQQMGIEHVSFYGATTFEERAEAERRFNFDPACKVFVGNPGAGGTGLNLLGYPPGNGDDYETNCNHEIYFSQDWSYTKRQQSEDRAHRRGTRSNVRITDLVIPATIDEQIRTRVVEKHLTALGVTDLREILSAALGVHHA